MEITSVKHSKTAIIGYKVNNQFFVPKHEDDLDYQDVKTWIAEGGIIEEEFTVSELLQEAKDIKISQLKSNRNNANLKPMSAVANEITHINGVFNETANQVSFMFDTVSSEQPATEPNTIILGVLLGSIKNSDFMIRYSCKINEGQEVRKGYVLLNESATSNIQAHLINRNENNISFTNDAEDEINAINTTDDIDLDAAIVLINAVDISFTS
jgi:hypothetical protein